MSSTILPNICTNRRYESQANRSLEVCFASPPTETSFNPRLRTVSIIPGIENAAPERTDTSSGSVRITEPLARLRFERGACLRDFVHQPVGHHVACGHVRIARFGGDGEAGRHGQAELGHLGEVGALAAEEELLLLRALLEREHVTHRVLSHSFSLLLGVGDDERPRQLVVDALAVRVAVAPQDHAETEQRPDRRDREREEDRNRRSARTRRTNRPATRRRARCGSCARASRACGR